MRGRGADRAHLVQNGTVAAARDLPCGFGAGQTAADDVDGWGHEGQEFNYD